MLSKTVFVVGAGASCEVGLPSGEELTSKIASLLNLKFKSGNPNPIEGHSLVAEALRLVGDFNAHLAASRRIAQGMPLAASIDEYIHAHEGDAHIELCGKVAIVASVLQAERASRLYADLQQGPDAPAPLSTVRGTWFTRCWQLLCEGCTSIEKLGQRVGHIKFIVFNYDRCIEHFMFHAAQQYYSVDRVKAALAVEKIKFFHPYGKLGALPWQSTAGDAVPYGAFDDLNGQQLLKLRENIRTFSESTEAREPDVAELRRALSDAARIVFLGFAYHPQNMRLLWPDKVPMLNPIKRFFGTAVGISASDVAIIKDDIQTHSGIQYVNDLGVLRSDLKCSQLFNEYRQSLSLL